MLGVPQQAIVTTLRAGLAGEATAYLHDQSKYPAAATLQLQRGYAERDDGSSQLESWCVPLARPVAPTLTSSSRTRMAHALVLAGSVSPTEGHEALAT